MSEVESNMQLIQAHETIRMLQEELAITNQGLVALTLELEQRVDERTAELRTTQEELQKTNSELMQMTLELEDRVNLRTSELREKNEEVSVMTEQLMQAAKLATLGELAASIAHELNNPLATISLRVESLMRQIPAEDPKYRPLSIVAQEAARMGNLVTTLLEFSRRSKPQITPILVHEELDKALDLIEFRLRKLQIKLIKTYSPEVPSIHADRQQLRQLFLNLYNNAIDAMLPPGGILQIGVRVEKSGAALNETQADPLSPPAYVIIEIADNGCGIPQELLPKVAEPFFTTKPEGKGTGLGLPICKRIVREHGGELNILSEGIPGIGTTIQIKLPVNGVLSR